MIKKIILSIGLLLSIANVLAADVLQKGNIILFRHANAPGVGDPPNFNLTDCATQRNLDEVGRTQAKRIGQHLRAQGIKVSRVYTSQWCRCKETAALAFPELVGKAIDENPVFSSFFNEREQEPDVTVKAKATLLNWKGPGYLVVVTHQVNITGVTGIFPQSGEGIVLQRNGLELKVVGRVAL